MFFRVFIEVIFAIVSDNVSSATREGAETTEGLAVAVVENLRDICTMRARIPKMHGRGATVATLQVLTYREGSMPT